MLPSTLNVTNPFWYIFGLIVIVISRVAYQYTMKLLPITSVVTLSAAYVVPSFASRLAPSIPTQIEATSPYGGADSSLLQFPGDWSRHTPPVPIHAHNAYLQPAFVYTALSYGVRSIEVDVWLYKDELYVGHDPFQLTQERTFRTLAVDAVLKSVEQANEGNHAKSNSSSAHFFKDLQVDLGAPDWWGYFGDVSTPIQLLIDIKTDGEKTWPKVVEQLEPLRERGYLTRYADGKIQPGAVLIIGTGNTPADQLVNEHERDVFIDGPLGNFSKPIVGTDSTQSGSQWNSTLAPIASVDFTKITTWTGIDEPSDEAKKNLTAAIDEAHCEWNAHTKESGVRHTAAADFVLLVHPTAAKSIQTRFWNTPQWPIFARDRVNTVLLQLGSDWINADDLEAVSRKF